MRFTRVAFCLTAFLIFLALVTSPSTSEPVFAQGENLLVNPSFEGEYSAYIPESGQEQTDCPLGYCNTAQIPAGWKAWWTKEKPTDVNPEYKPAERNVAGARVRSGDRAAQYFSFWSTHTAGLRQQVTVPENSTVRFAVWGQTWLTEEDNSIVSDYAGTANMRVGIDPTGGSDIYSPAIVWSGYVTPFDNYQYFEITAQAQGSTVTVFTFAAPGVNPNSPEYGFKHTDVYWDDAELIVVGAGSAPPPPGDTGGGDGVAPPPPAPIGPQPTPNADGVIQVIVQSGDSLWGIAARNGLTIDEIYELNGLNESTIVRVGDVITVGFAEPPEEEAPDDAAVEDGEGGPADTPVDAEPTATPLPPTPTLTPAPNGGNICLKAFDDVNQNGLHDADESLKAGVAFTVSDASSVVFNYVSDGFSEPYCVQQLNAGNYRITRSVGAGESLTTTGDWAVSLAAGGEMAFEFGSFVDESAVAVAEAGVAVESDAPEVPAGESAIESGESGGLGSILVIVVVIIAVLLLLGVVALVLSSRRATV